jgi:hypothetical protein
VSGWLFVYCFYLRADFVCSDLNCKSEIAGSTQYIMASCNRTSLFALFFCLVIVSFYDVEVSFNLFFHK